MSDWPGVLNQVTFAGAGNVDDCWVVATVWAAVAFRTDIHRPDVPEFRRHARDPDDGHDDGGSLVEVVRGARGTWPSVDIERFDGPWAGFRDRVRAGRPASLAVDSGRLPASMRFGFTDAHQIGVVWDPARETFLVANPLARQGSRPLPIEGTDLRDAARALPFGGNVRAAIFPTRRQGGDMAIFEISPPDTGPYPVTVKAGTTIFAQDGTTRLGTIDDPSLPFIVVGESADGKLVFLHGRVGGSRTPLGVVARSSTRRG